VRTAGRSIGGHERESPRETDCEVSNNRPARWLFIRTAAASALVALLVALRLDLEWAGIFAIGAVAGLLNWFLLAVILIQFTERRRAYVPMLVIAKMILLVGSVFVILPLVPHQAVAFLCGFTMFLILVVAEAFGQLLMQVSGGGSPNAGLPLLVKSFTTGARTDA